MSLLAVVLYRLGNSARRSPLAGASHLIKGLGMMLTGAELDGRAHIGPGLVLQHPVGVVVGHQVVAGANLHLFGGITLGWRRTRHGEGQPRLGDNVTVYANATVLGPVHIGDGAVIGPHALVLRDVAPGETVFGPRSD